MSFAPTQKFRWNDPADLTKLALVLAVGGICGTLATFAHLPLPFMLGGLFGSLLVSGIASKRGIAMSFPKPVRMFFVGLIGAMIGGTFSPELVQIIPSMIVSMLGVMVYIAVAHATGYLIYRRVGGHDAVTSFYASMPGGLIEAVELGERAGGDMRVITLSHFVRVTFVVTSISLIFWALSGKLVGSAAGQSFEAGQATPTDVALLVAMTLSGLLLGRKLHVPAAHLLGPLLVSALLHGFGAAAVTSPTWLLYIAQLVVGAGLGAQFSGATWQMLKGVLRTTLLATTTMIAISAGLALLLIGWTNLRGEALFLSFAPGGVTEMGLIALSLGISPVMVAAHHVFRIFLTVSVAALSTRFFRPK